MSLENFTLESEIILGSGALVTNASLIRNA